MWSFADPGREEGLVARGASVAAIALIISLEVLVRYFEVSLEVLVRYFEVSLVVFIIFAEDYIMPFVLELILVSTKFLS